VDGIWFWPFWESTTSWVVFSMFVSLQVVALLQISLTFKETELKEDFNSSRMTLLTGFFFN